MTNDFATLTRRRVLAGTLGAGALGLGMAATAGLGLARAQEATPEPEDDTSDEGVSGTTEEETTEAAEAVERASTAIAEVQADRDAVASQIDAATVDELLTQATALRDRAEAAADAGDADEARRLARAASATAKAAGELVEAQLITAGLPSQEAAASRILANAFEAIENVGEDTAASTDADVAFFVTTAQALYQSSFDLFGSGIYGQAARTAAVAAQVARIGAYLADPDGETGLGGGRGRRGRGRPDDRDGDEDADDEPVTVPEPAF